MAQDLDLEKDLAQYAVNQIGLGPESDDRSAGRVAMDQLKQVPAGLADMVKSLSPVRFREGWGSPTLEVPEAVQNSAKVGYHLLTKDAKGLGQDVQQFAQPLTTTARNIGALALPDYVNPATREQNEAATRGATQYAAAAIAPKVLPKLAEVPGLQQAATSAGIPQLLSEIANTGLMRHTPMGPLLSAVARRLYSIGEPTPPYVYNAEFVNSPEHPIDVPHYTIQRPQLPAAPQAPQPQPQAQVAGSVGQRLLPETASPGTALPPGVQVTQPSPIPGGRGQWTGSGVITGGRGGQLFGEEGGIPQRGEQTVTGVKPKPVRTPEGPMRKGTADDLRAQRGTAGRTVREPEKPTPPKKGRGGK